MVSFYISAVLDTVDGAEVVRRRVGLPVSQALQTSYDVKPIAEKRADHKTLGCIPANRPFTPSCMTISLAAMGNDVPGLMTPVAMRDFRTSKGVVHELESAPANEPAITNSVEDNGLDLSLSRFMKRTKPFNSSYAANRIIEDGILRSKVALKPR